MVGFGALMLGAGIFDASDGVVRSAGRRGRRRLVRWKDDPRAFRGALILRYGLYTILPAVFGLAFLAAGLAMRKDRMPRTLIIAVDGPAASGKGSIASRLAAHYGLPHLDTGLLYRATGVKVLAAGADLGDAEAAARAAESVTPGDLIDETALTSRGAGEAASRVASHPGVRAALLNLQQDFARQAGGAVLDGRDIGTVIAPDAPVKLFVTATAETRARRRWLQLTGRGETIAFDDMLADIIRRDERDAGRGAAPMVMADDAALLDTTEMDIETAFDAARRIVEAARVRHGF